ncbi:MAG: sigma-54 dependent transcriptional regulator, partial [Spirochaetales bacterium]|nr:sigma-54 dependent transcriptional regulator [Spirochaetales bacterium]
MSRILIIDDEEGIRSVLSDILSDEGHQVSVREDGVSGLQAVSQEAYDVVFLDIWMPEKGGIDVLREIKETYPLIEVVMISGHANIDMAVSAIKLGAFDFLQKPLSLERVITVVNNALHIEELKRENRELRKHAQPREKLLGSSPAMTEIHERIEQSAASEARILITGENGTGKELAAREIHEKSPRADKPFVEVNCAAIPDTLIESELFGHEKGAFTGAVSSRKGQFEMADGGTLFLDEIADMSLSAQAKVLRAIQEQTIQRVGGEAFIRVNLRIITATNKNPQEEVRQGRFREDLFFRLNVIPLQLPPLRTRPEDIPLLVKRFMTL